MRIDASLEQWRVLYEAATRIKELKPWEKFWDMDLIGIKYGEEEDTVFFSILGRGGNCYGIAVYEGYKGLNSFLMLAMQQKMNLSEEYAMFNQRNLTCYWGNRDELTDKQRKIVKDLGYSYRGKNQWLYFLSFEPGYYPYNLDSEEVVRMSEFFQDLELALKYYDETNISVDFENGNMFLLSFDKDKTTWNFKESQLPFTTFQFGNLLITTVINFKMTEPDDDPMVILAETVMGFIFQYGAPKEIRVTNVIVEAGLEQICDVSGIICGE